MWVQEAARGNEPLGLPCPTKDVPTSSMADQPLAVCEIQPSGDASQRGLQALSDGVSRAVYWPTLTARKEAERAKDPPH